jgi:Domain of unknown function (DUF397)
MWRKSSFSNPSGNCLEFEWQDGVAYLRDSKEQDAADRVVLSYDEGQWQGGEGVKFTPFAAGISGVIPAMRRLHLMQAAISRDADITGSWYCVEKDGAALYFTQAEKDAFEKAVAAGETSLAA